MEDSTWNSLSIEQTSKIVYTFPLLLQCTNWCLISGQICLCVLSGKALNVCAFHVIMIALTWYKKMLKITKGESEAVYWRKTDNTKDGQTKIYKTLHRNLKIKQQDPWKRARVLQGDTQFLLRTWHQSSHSCYTVISHEWGKNGIIITTNGTYSSQLWHKLTVFEFLVVFSACPDWAFYSGIKVYRDSECAS